MKWMSNPEIKDKNGLQEARRRIEIEMERFKAFERESKTKPFSLIGLAMSDRLDAQESRRQERREQLEDIVDRFNMQADEFRAEWEGLTAKKKKTREETERIDQLKRYIDWHAFHIRSLEQVLRRLDNGMIDPDDLEMLVDSLDIFMEQFEDPDYYHDDGLYEQYSLDSDAVDATYYNPTLEENADEAKKASSGTGVLIEPPKVREIPMTAAAKAKAKRQAAREFEAAQTGGPVRPDHPAQIPPKPQRPATPTISPPSLPTPPNPPNRPAPILPGILVSPPVPPPKILGVWDTSEPASQSRAPPPPPPYLVTRSEGILGLLHISSSNRGQCEDMCRVRAYAPSNPFLFGSADRAVYPPSVASAESPQSFAKLPLDALILIFYYREGTYAQYLASQELKRQNWRFHKKFGIWFKRVDGAIRTINPAFEYGSYNYFDVTSEAWGPRLRNDFTFEYEYLEEDSVPVLGDDCAVRRPSPLTPQGRVVRS